MSSKVVGGEITSTCMSVQALPSGCIGCRALRYERNLTSRPSNIGGILNSALRANLHPHSAGPRSRQSRHPFSVFIPSSALDRCSTCAQCRRLPPLVRAATAVKKSSWRQPFYDDRLSYWGTASGSNIMQLHNFPDCILSGTRGASRTLLILLSSRLVKQKGRSGAKTDTKRVRIERCSCLRCWLMKGGWRKIRRCCQ